jgi:hypothetical protein
MHPNSLANLKPFEPGNRANPGGKPKGARDRVNVKFLEALEQVFDECGKEALQRCCKEDPSAFVRALLALVPKELEISQDPFAWLTDEQLVSVNDSLRVIVAAQEASKDETAP